MHKLKIDGKSLFLDGIELQGVTGFRINGGSWDESWVELDVTLLVQPPKDEPPKEGK